MKELDLKLTVGMAERRKAKSPPDEELGGRGQRFKSNKISLRPKVRVWLFLVQSVTEPVGHSSDVKHRPKN